MSRDQEVQFSELVNFFPKQEEATRLADTNRMFLYGGARGPGKSYWLRWYSLRFLLRCAGKFGVNGVRTMLACENFPALRDRQIEKIQSEFPEWLGRWWPSAYEFRLRETYGGGVICCRNLDDASKYQSAEFALIAVDELTKNSQKTFDILRGSLRWPGLDRTQFVGATNPTGTGAPWVRRLWIEGQFGDQYAHMADQFAFLPGVAGDNPHLDDAYMDELLAQPGSLRKAWLEGDWYAGVEGLVYPEFNEQNLTDDEPDPNLPVELAADDGYMDPRAILFIQRTGSRILVFDEIYERQTLAESSVRKVLERSVSRAGVELPDDSDGWTLEEFAAWCMENDVPLPEMCIGSPEAKEMQARFRLANIPFRWIVHKVVDGLAVVRRLMCDGHGYRTLQVHRRCRNLIWELTEGYQYREGKQTLMEKPQDGNDHASDGLRYWCYVRARR